MGVFLTELGGGGGSSGGIGGSIASTQVPYGTGVDTIGGEAAFAYNATTNTLSVPALSMAGSGSGAANIVPAAAAGTPTLTWPTVTGTIAATTGALTDGHVAAFNSSGQIVDGGALPVVPGLVLTGMPPTGAAVTYPTWPTDLNLRGPTLTTLDLSGLTSIVGNFNPISMGSLTSIDIADLVYVGGAFNPTTLNVLTAMNAGALKAVGGAFNPNTMALLTALDVSGLEYIGGAVTPSTMALLTTLNLGAVRTIGFSGNSNNFNPSSMAALTSVDLSALETILGNISITSGVGALTTLTLTSALKRVDGNTVISSAALNQATVDNILVLLAALDGTNGTTAYSSKTVTLTGTSAAPSATGLAAKATLVGRGCTVTNN